MHTSSHIKLARQYWQSWYRKLPPLPTPLVLIDATCGNGWDTLFLAKEFVKTGTEKLYAFDIQKIALEKTYLLLKSELSPSNLDHILFINSSHEDLSSIPEEIDLVVYNLGYLPGGDKTKTTLINSTLISLEQALFRLKPSGLITLTCYPGHREGQIEESVLVDRLSSLDRSRFQVSYHRWINQNKAPSLLVIEGRN